MANRLLERLADGPPLVADGGMGVLVSSAAPRVRIPEEANLRAPETVVKLHVGFIQAGADVIETNTFGANRRKLAANYLEDELHAINSTGVKLAREAREISGRDVFIAGSIGPLGEPRHRPRRAPARSSPSKPRSSRAAASTSSPSRPSSSSTSSNRRSRPSAASPRCPCSPCSRSTPAPRRSPGSRPRAPRNGSASSASAAIGANHGAGIQAALAALSEMGGNGLPLAAMPNIGLASMAGNRIIYPHASPEYFAEFAAHARNLGARVIGGCCGTTPTEIAAIASAVKEEREPSAPLVFAEREVHVAVPEQREETELARAFRENEWVLSVQIDPPLGGSYAGMIDVARALKESGNAGFVDINDNATARAAASALMLAVEIERSAAVETIPHLTTRDATIMGLESQLLGAHACGIRNVLSVTGDPPEVGDYPGSRGVYEIDSIGLTQLMARLNRGEDYNGRAIDAATSFHIGVAVNPAADDLDIGARPLPPQDRSRRALRDDADPVRPRVHGPLRRAARRRVADPGARRDLPRLEPPARAPPPQRGARNRRPAAGARRAPRRRAERGRGRDWRSAASCSKARATRAQGAYVVAPFRRPLGILDLLS